MKKSEFVKKVQALAKMGDSNPSEAEILEVLHVFEKAGMQPPQTTKTVIVKDMILLRSEQKFISVNEWDPEDEKLPS